MGFRFQRRIRLAPGVRLNLLGASLGRTGMRVGLDSKRKKYFSVGLPGTGLSYRTFFGRPVTPQTLKRVGYAVLVAAILCIGVLVIVASRSHL
jgi:hypothetical protein